MAFPDQLWTRAAGSDGGCWRPRMPSGKGRGLGLGLGLAGHHREANCE